MVSVSGASTISSAGAFSAQRTRTCLRLWRRARRAWHDRGARAGPLVFQPYQRGRPSQKISADPARPVARPQEVRAHGPAGPCGIGGTSAVQHEDDPRFAWSGKLCGYLRPRPQPTRTPPSSAGMPDPNWRAMVFARPRGVLCGGTLLPWSSAGSYGSRDRPVHLVPAHPRTGHRPARLAWQRPTPQIESLPSQR